jgi:HD-like signal output (HDOD) protein
VTAHLLASDCRMLDPERVFVAGLLHDLGHLIMYQEVPELAAAALQTFGDGAVELCQAERSLLGFDYAEVGGELLAQWGLPESLVEAVRLHTDPARATRHPLLASLVHIARRALEATEQRCDGADAAVHPSAWATTALAPQALGPALAEAEARVGAIMALLLG